MNILLYYSRSCMHVQVCLSRGINAERKWAWVAGFGSEGSTSDGKTVDCWTDNKGPRQYEK